jgi:regulator of sigma E protease
MIDTHPEMELLLTVRRNGYLVDVPVTPVRSEDGTGKIGARVAVPDVLPSMPEDMERLTHYSPVAAIPKAFEESWSTTVLIVDSLKKMISGLISVKNLSGPITIATVAGDTVKSGVEYFLWFLAMLSITLGVMNLLPIPVLDGGHLLYNFIEFVIRRPVPERFQQWGMQFGLLLIIGFTFIAFYNDFNRLL